MRVRRLVALGLCLGLIGLAGCSSSDKGVDPGPVEEPLATAVIGPGGGSVSGGQITVSAPPGAFPGNVQLEIYLSTEDSPFGAAQGSPLFRLEGLPPVYSQPLEIRFSVPGGGSDALVAMGEENFSTTVGSLITGYRMLATTVTDTLAVAALPAAADVVGGVQESLPVWFVRVDGYEVDSGGALQSATNPSGGPAPAPSQAGTFRVAFPKGKAAEAALMRGYLQDAYNTFTAWPFSFARRTSWPISVTLGNLPPDVSGYFVPSRMGNNHGSLEFNLAQLADPAEARATAAHELLHLGQALHDDRNRWTKARNTSDRYWLDEACSAWCEAEAAHQAGFKSKVIAGHQMAPFESIHVPGGGNRPDHHGYGMAPLLEYLSRRQGKAVVGQIYEYILEHGNDPVEALNSVQTDHFIVWYPRFLRQLLQGELTTEVSLADAITAASATWEIRSSGDTKKTYKADYGEGSARFYKIKPARTDFSPAAVLEVTLDDAVDGLLNVYRYRGLVLEPLGVAAGAFQVTDLDELADEGWFLLVMVTDSHLTAPYTARHSLTLNLEVKTPPGFSEGWANIAGEGNYSAEHVRGDSTWTTEESRYTSWVGGLPGFGFVPGSSRGNTFSASFGGSSSGVSYTGSLSITVDDADDPKQVVSFTYTTQQSHSVGGIGVREYTCSGGGLPLVAGNGGEYSFTIDGSGASGAVNSVSETETYESENYQRTETLEDTNLTYVTVLLRR